MSDWLTKNKIVFWSTTTKKNNEGLFSFSDRSETKKLNQ